jgi:hypothetical protein
MRKVLALTAGLMCALMALAACGGSSSNSKGSSSGSSAFNALLDKSKNATIKITYTTLDNSGNVSDTWTIAQDGSSKVAYEDKDSKFVTVNGTTTSCSNLDTEPDCTTLPGDAGTNLASGLTGLYTAATSGLAAAAAANGIGKQSDDTIAGRSATCVTLTVGSALGNVGKAIAKAAGGNTGAGYETCVDKDTGFLLKYVVVGVGTDKSGIVATVVGQPTDADFATPSTTTTTGGSSDTSGSGNTTETTSPSGGSGTTVACTPMTLPNGITLPPGITSPCASPG